jgi:transglutaminase/protease-like cytokinesis protein 3
VLAIHDWICEHVVYGEAENGSDQDIYGALFLRKARCAGYAKAFSYLLNRVGIKSEVISGESIDKTGVSVSHAWNLVYIDEKPYYFDITWNDDDKNGHAYDWFGVTSAEFQTSHSPSIGYEWVEATATDACYYIKNGMYIKSYSTTNLSRQIIKQGKSFYIKCANREVLNKTIKAFSDKGEIQKIMQTTGIAHIGQIIYIENPNTNCLYVQIK